MRKAAVRHGDPTTTHGFVMAFSSTIHDDGKKVALSGDEATCGNCKGVFKIFGTGQGMSEEGRDVVVDGDQVLCPCKKTRLIVGSSPGIFLETTQGSAEARKVTSASNVAAVATPSQAIDGAKHARWCLV
ncbi:PAAR domain-containing protein [Paraburkholderia sp. FT54]|uniref:PAAR domain-containing protein n=1 Tax=Paraburkholderia sp. FT54 TaxID=3074437 RepID=UPI002877E128|nr:PAAR domain-containing protein [Paraburkholderia sp. FT54]WNC92705.1 PAAR domain-containing protein [Paraburkholderia sp. FT54]